MRSLLSLAVLSATLSTLPAAPVVGTTAAAQHAPAAREAEVITPGGPGHTWRHLAPPAGKAGAKNIPQWSAIYDFDIETNGTGTTDFTNLLCAFSSSVAPLTHIIFSALVRPALLTAPSSLYALTLPLLGSAGDANLTALEVAVTKFPTQKAMWSAVASCEPNATKVFGEPYCGGPTGLWAGVSRGGMEWKTGADSWVASIKDKKW